MSSIEVETHAPSRDIYSVSRLNLEVRSLLEGSFPLIWLEGELSNLARPGSGHWYFSLKDDAAQVRCAMFRNRNRLVKGRVENGLQVLVRARIGLYEARGEYQLIIEHMEDAGDGALRRAFEQLKHQLQQDGLFETQHKRPLPALPRRIGVITSPTGAAVRDILTTLKRRFPAIPVMVYPVPVQGETAAAQIASSIRLAARRAECDVLILARGGGSLEDLWAFNQETVARAIFDCPLPIVSGIGHEVDVTIADFVADQRAATPTAAAELVSPDQQVWQQRLTRQRVALHRVLKQCLANYQTRLSALQHRLPHPRRRLESALQRLDELTLRRTQVMRHSLRHRNSKVRMMRERLQQHSPRQRLQNLRIQSHTMRARLQAAMQHQLQQQRQQLQYLAHGLHSISPLATLSRGYAIVSKHDEKHILRNSSEVQRGDTLLTRLAKGRLHSTVTQIEHDDDNSD